MEISYHSSKDTKPTSRGFLSTSYSNCLNTRQSKLHLQCSLKIQSKTNSRNKCNTALKFLYLESLNVSFTYTEYDRIKGVLRCPPKALVNPEVRFLYNQILISHKKELLTEDVIKLD